MVIIKVIVYLFKRDNSNVQVFDGPALLIPIWKKTKWGTNNTLKMKKKNYPRKLLTSLLLRSEASAATSSWTSVRR